MQINLSKFMVNKSFSCIMGTIFKKEFPSQVTVYSEKTGRKVKFNFDRYEYHEENFFWDGVQAIYKPLENIPGIEFMSLVRSEKYEF